MNYIIYIYLLLLCAILITGDWGSPLAAAAAARLHSSMVIGYPPEVTATYQEKQYRTSLTGR